MSNKNKIESLLKELFAYSKKTLSFTDIKLKDGTCLRTASDSLTQGDTLTLVGKDGTETPAPDGDHTTTDGTVISIKSGVAETITPGTAPATADKMDTPVTAPESTTGTKMDDATPAQAPATGDNSTDAVNTMDMTKLVETIKNLIDRISSLEEKYSSTSMAVEKMSAQPAAKPFIADPFNEYKEGTVGYELAKFNAEIKAKKQKQSFENIAKANSNTNVKFKSANPLEVKTEKFSAPKEMENPLLGFNGSFSIE